jgi:CubicO group peptidase (beta-lactamase class C family)
MLDRRSFLAALGAVAAAPALARGTRWARVQALLDRYVSEQKIAGATAALAIGDRPLTYVSAGTLALDSTVAAGEDTLWRIYSMTKPVTGTAAALLIEDGKLKLDQPVADFFPAYRKLTVAIDPDKSLDARPARTALTVRHLLTHTGGLTYFFAGKGPVQQAYRANGLFGVAGLPPEPGDGAEPPSLAAFADRLTTVPLISDPGARYHYSVGLDLLGAVIERASGMPFDIFLRTRIFDPLDMRSTAFRALDAGRFATNYLVTPKGLLAVDTPVRSAFTAPPKVPYGGAGLVSSARDYARFGMMLLNDGALGSARIMSPATARLIRSDLLPRGVRALDDGSGYGAGGRVVTADTKGANDAVGSYGWGGAAGTSFWINPRQRAMVTLMTQFMPAETYPLRDQLRGAIAADIA